MPSVHGYGDVMIPRFTFGGTEMDLLRITKAGYLYEYEIKVSRQDYLKDNDKTTRYGKKHDSYTSCSSEYTPNRFFYVVPYDLISETEIPKKYGLIYYRASGSLTLIKNASFLHKKVFPPEFYREICVDLSSRDVAHKKRIERIRNKEAEFELAKTQRELDALKSNHRELSNELWLLKANSRRVS